MIPAHFICWNHFYSFLSVQIRVQETRRSGPLESRHTLSRRNHFSSFLPGETGGQGARRSGPLGCTALFFRGNQFSSFLPAGTAALEAKRSGSPGCTAPFSREPVFLIPSAGTAALEAKRSGSPGCTALFFQGNHFSSFPLFHGRRWPHQTFSSSSSSSSSPQRDSGILAVRKTGASVFSLLPPTS